MLLLKLFILFPLILIAALLLVRLLQARRQQQALQAIRQRLQTAHPPQPGEQQITVDICTPAHGKRLWPLHDSDAAGVLNVGKNGLRLHAETLAGPAMEQYFPRDAQHIRWLGRHGLRQLDRYWLLLGNGEVLRVRPAGGVKMAAQSSPSLYRALLGDATPASVAVAGFALESNPAAQRVTTAFAVLGLYALWQLVLAPRWVLLHPGKPLLLAALALPALLGAGLALRALLRDQVPKGAAALLSVLLFGSLLAGGLAGLLQLDRILATPQRHAYAMQQTDYFRAAGLPDLDLRSTRGYWAPCPKGHTEQFTLAHGPLGFWQLDSDSYADAVQFYQRAQLMAQATGTMTRVCN
ncbi:hypothetical protein SAMN02745857_02890 [Andreprevotia lacus DSM 23236]|jgi:hypothetical protein|uniref:Uncharacterized protein n=1 Tax=Andreprevotia lacus DSM 23236 TaxID=1121001 RepID=A0A1W1XUJ6_9NEIS|nr:hypothetical protein [Andreprevotia lacus]SMC27514.1 hypothetical protein SAMN02745857_02890 [Andreprevotia lacus DSM 23236]